MAYRRYYLDSTFLPELIKWFNDLDSTTQFRQLPFCPVPILIEALKKNLNFQFEAVFYLEQVGPLAIEAIPFLNELKRTTSNKELQLRIENAVKVIVDK